MIHIILLILKILGIILLSLIGLIVLLICVILFAPIKYKIEGSIDNSIDSLKSKGHIIWLFRLIHIFYNYEEGEFQWQGRIAWHRLDEEEIEHEIKENIKEAKHEVFQKEKDIIKDGKVHTPTYTEVEEVVKEEQHDKRIEADKIKKVEKEPEERKKKVNKFQEFKNKCKIKYRRIQKFFKNIKYTFRRFCDTISNISEQKETFINFCSNEIHKYTFTKCKEELLYLWKHTKPKKLQIKGEFGFEDPSVTGKTLAVMSVFQFFYGKDIQIKPNFENPIYVGEFLVKGNLRVIHLVVIAFRLMKDRKVRLTYKHIKKLKFFNNEEKQEA